MSKDVLGEGHQEDDGVGNGDNPQELVPARLVNLTFLGDAQ